MTCYDVPFLGVEHDGPCSTTEDCGDSMTCYEHSVFERRCQCLAQYLPKDNGFCGTCTYIYIPAATLSLHATSAGCGLAVGC